MAISIDSFQKSPMIVEAEERLNLNTRWICFNNEMEHHKNLCVKISMIQLGIAHFEEGKRQYDFGEDGSERFTYSKECFIQASLLLPDNPTIKYESLYRIGLLYLKRAELYICGLEKKVTINQANGYIGRALAHFTSACEICETPLIQNDISRLIGIQYKLQSLEENVIEINEEMAKKVGIFADFELGLR